MNRPIQPTPRAAVVGAALGMWALIITTGLALGGGIALYLLRRTERG